MKKKKYKKLDVILLFDIDFLCFRRFYCMKIDFYWLKSVVVDFAVWKNGFYELKSKT